jgi:hypothetical protein
MTVITMSEYDRARRDHQPPAMRPRPEVHAGFLDGHQGPRRCSCGCRAVISGAPVVSEGVPYLPGCYLAMRRRQEAAGVIPAEPAAV